jgi:hypothetical protein
MDEHHSYRFYVMSRDHRLARSSDVECDGDEQARRVAIEIFGEQDRAAGIEVWDRGRMIFCYP